MSRIVWFIAYGLIGLWTLMAWGGNALMSKLLDYSANNVHSVFPPNESADWMIWLLHRMDDFSGPIVGVIWFFGAAVIYGIAWLITRVARGRSDGRAVQPYRQR